MQPASRDPRPYEPREVTVGRWRVTALLDDHIAMRVDNGRALWGLISWVLWHEQCIQAHSTS